MENNEQLLYKDLDDIDVSINPVRDYINHAITYLIKRCGITKEEAKQKIKTILKNKSVRVPNLKFKHKQSNGDMVVETMPITDYIKDIRANNEIIVPSFTAYYSPNKLKSVHAEFMQHNVRQRSKFKKEAFRLKQEGDIEKSEYNNIMQKTMKIFNNSLSGAYSSKSSVLRNPSAHYTLTSITRCLSSIGNSVSESFLAGNKHFRNANNVYNYISAVLSSIDKNRVEIALKKYNLAIPTVEHIMDNIETCSKWYWNDETVIRDIRDYVSKLDDSDRAIVLYTNNFWDIARLNQDLIRDFMSKITKKCCEPMSDVSFLIKLPEDILTLTKIICSDDVKGKNLDLSSLQGTELGNILGSTAKNIVTQLYTINYLFHTFFLTNILPIDIARIKDMLRDVIVLSDTDSTCATYDKWVKWYFGKEMAGQDGINIASVIMTLNSRAIDHALKILGKCMNIPKDRIELLKMKNEFYWQVFTTGANVNKHYFANTLIQEGNVFKEPELELKGVHLIASTANQEYVSKIHNMMREINQEISHGRELCLLKYIKMIANMEREIINRIEQGDISVYKLDKIKDAKSYKVSDIKMSPYVYHLLWKEVFSDKYGYPGEPQYTAIKFPTTLDTKIRTINFVNNIDDIEIREKLKAYMVKYNKDMIGSFKLPLTIVGSKGVPIELIGCVNKTRIVMDNLNVGYKLLESIGFFKKSEALLIDMGY